MCQILDDLISQRPEDSEMAEAFALAKLTSGISVHSLKPELRDRVTNDLRQTVIGILSGAISSGIHKQPYGDARTAEQYFEALRDLLQAIP